MVLSSRIKKVEDGDAHLILASARARRSVFWNKARTRLLISVAENSDASGPFPSAHL